MSGLAGGSRVMLVMANYVGGSGGVYLKVTGSNVGIKRAGPGVGTHGS